MVNEPAYAPPLIETARAHITTVVDALSAATGLKKTFISEVAKGDRAFLSRIEDTVFSFRTYDEVMGRLSAAWPDSAPWPETVPRYPPTDLPDDIRAELDRRLSRAEEEKAARVAELKAELARLGADPTEAAQAPANP